MKKKENIVGYDYSTRDAREETVNALFLRAKTARTTQESLWRKYNNYYNFCHDALDELKDWLEEQGIKWEPTMMPDAWAIVESQVNPNVPEPEFRGRDSDRDSQKAKQRQYAVQYICENNRLSHMNTRNERRLLKYGDAFWKAYWDTEMRCGAKLGDIRIRDVSMDSIYPDPSVRDGSLQDGQYLCYVYRIHVVRFLQLFGEDLERIGADVEEQRTAPGRGGEGNFDTDASLY